MSDHKNGASPPDQSIVVQIADKSRADATGRPVGLAGDALDQMRNQAFTEEAMHRPLTDDTLAQIQAEGLKDLKCSLLLIKPHWWPVIREWLVRYERLEQFLAGPSDLPVAQVVDVFVQSKDASDQIIAERLAVCDFVCWRVRLLKTEPPSDWDFRDGSLQAFLAQGLPEEFSIYQATSERPDPVDTIAWILDRLNAETS